eukprot:TRINITY_DN13995_c0_g1_i1.p1 TRINITY_DN13995_c0_g1~~TRINITY_DN13995_c0_g1_i1.p1  ORF type:complete len:183 (+),score=20.57 TRINITY_DN13995_c0_g1_i1:47-595(+)
MADRKDGATQPKRRTRNRNKNKNTTRNTLTVTTSDSAIATVYQRKLSNAPAEPIDEKYEADLSDLEKTRAALRNLGFDKSGERFHTRSAPAATLHAARRTQQSPSSSESDSDEDESEKRKRRERRRHWLESGSGTATTRRDHDHPTHLTAPCVMLIFVELVIFALIVAYFFCDVVPSSSLCT